MAQIYNQASKVQVWLVEEDTLEHGETEDARLFLSLCRQPSPWWKRLWIVQECAHAEKCPVVMIGAHSMSYERLIERWDSAIRLVDQSQGNMLKGNILKANLEFLRTPFNVWTAQKEENKHRLPLAQRLRETVGRECAEPHDRVYALLSLNDENEAKQLRPDYQKPYLELALEVVEVLRRSPWWDERRDSDLFRLLDPVLRSTVFPGCQIHMAYREILIQALHDGNRKRIHVVLDKRIEYFASPGEMSRAICVATELGYEDVVQKLLFRRPDVNLTFVPFALYNASLGGHEKVVEILVNRGVDVNAHVNSKGSIGGRVSRQGGAYGTALHAALERGHEKTLQMLIDVGADVNARGGASSNALQAASLGGYEKIVHMLIHKAADINA